MQYRKLKNLIALLLFALGMASALAAPGQHAPRHESAKSRYMRCKDGETKRACLMRHRFANYRRRNCANESRESCLQRFRHDWAKRAPERRKHIRRIVIERREYRTYEHRKQRNFKHPMASPEAGKIRVGKGRLSREQREELRRMINEVNRDRRYRHSDSDSDADSD